MSRGPVEFSGGFEASGRFNASCRSAYRIRPISEVYLSPARSESVCVYGDTARGNRQIPCLPRAAGALGRTGKSKMSVEEQANSFDCAIANGRNTNSESPTNRDVLRQVFHFQRRLRASSSSSVRGQSDRNNRDKPRSARTFPPVWHRAQ